MWRVLNYGFLPTLKYFISHRLGSKSRNKNLEEMSLASFAKLIGVEEDSERDSRAIVASMVNQMRDQMKIESDGRKIKNVLGSDSSIARLIILELAIRSSRFNSFLETGTQHGLSAFVVNESARRYSLDMNIASFDVSHEQYFVKSAGVTYFALLWPVRRNFKKETLNMKLDPLLFFHDSDHSYENMFFEFQWAWNHLQAQAIISDDVDGNDAFFDFCKSSGITGYRIMIDHGPAVGFVMRNI
jgi:hypothetical protein